MKIIVKNLKGTQFEIICEPSNTVNELKQKIQEEQKIESSTQKLVAVGKVMADDKTLEEYKLKDGDFIVVMIAKPKKKKATPAPAPAQAPAPAPASNAGSNPPAATGTGSAMPPPANVPAASNPPAATGAGNAPAAGANEGGNGMMSAEELESTLTELQSLGYSRDECMRALRAAFYNPDRAAEFLFTGIPEQPEEQPAPGASAPGAGVGGGDATGGAGDATGLEFLRNNPMFTAIRERIIREPNFFQTFMNQLATTQPQLHQAISANPQAFLSLLLGSQGEGGAEGAQDPPNTIRVTQEEKEAIERLTALGFPKHRAIEAYIACDKNEEWAANYLFENVGADDQYDQDLVQEESRQEAEAQNIPVANPGGDAPMQPESQQNDAPANDNMEVEQPAAENPPAAENAEAQNPPAAENQPAAQNPAPDNAPAEGNPPGNNQPEGDDNDESCL